MYTVEQTDRGKGLRAEDGQALPPVRSAEDGGIRRGEGLLPPFDHAHRSLGSSASRNASPSTTSDSTVAIKQPSGNSSRWG